MDSWHDHRRMARSAARASQRALPSRVRGLALLIAVASMAFARDADAQRSRLVGVVVVADSPSTPVAGATVLIAALRLKATTNDSGIFVFTDLPFGSHGLSVRRLGYEPQDLSVAVAEPIDSISVRLITHALALDGVAVSAAARRQRKNIEAFYERVWRGMGTYVTRADIVARKPMSTTDMLRTVPGIRVLRMRGIDGVRFNTSAVMRRDCAPLIWLDGQRAPGLELGEVPVGDVEGIELYNGPSTTPMQFSQGPTAPACGVVVVWTRPPNQP